MNASLPTDRTHALRGAEFSRRLIAWQRRAGRHDLPWQNTRDPYRIWLSEIMLQQTQVSAVVPYYLRFLERFATLQTLADAPLDDVMRLWSGLGYYSRARNLHACAVRIVAEFDGAFPQDPEQLASLPGIGRSTAAAIAVFAFGAQAAILDGNVKRVLCRVFGIDGYPGERAVEKQLWALAEELLPKPRVARGRDEERIIDYTQGLMDLGATLCTPKNPDCAMCPMQADCYAHRQACTDRLPTKKKKAALPERAIAMLVLTHGQEVLLQKRPPTGIWGGLWSLPECPADASDKALRASAERHGQILTIVPLEPFTHTFTHFRLNVTPYRVELTRLTSGSDPSLGSPATQANRVAEPGPDIWLDLHEARHAALPTPIRKLIASLAD